MATLWGTSSLFSKVMVRSWSAGAARQSLANLISRAAMVRVVPPGVQTEPAVSRAGLSEPQAPRAPASVTVRNAAAVHDRLHVMARTLAPPPERPASRVGRPGAGGGEGDSMRRLFAVAMVGLLVLVLSGCGDDDETTTESGGSATTTTMGDMENMPGMTTGDGHDQMDAAKCEPSGTSLSIVASGTKFDKDCLAAPANQPVTISFENKDTIGHSLVVLKSHTSTDVIARADVFTGPK